MHDYWAQIKSYLNSETIKISQLKTQITKLYTEISMQGKHKKSRADIPLTYQESAELNEMIKKLPKENILEISKMIGKGGTDQLVIRIDELDTRTARSLQKYVKQQISAINKRRKKKPIKKTFVPEYKNY